VTIYRSAAAASPAAAISALSAGTVAAAGTFTVPAGAPVVGASLGHRELAEADHWILALDPAPVLACTHLVREPFPHVAISLIGGPSAQPAVAALPDVQAAFDAQPALEAAAAQAAAGTSGRAVIFPGVENLVGTLSIADVLALSAIEKIEVLGGEIPDPEALLETTDFVRPQYRAGQLILTAMPAMGGRLVPFETRTPTPCCAAH
jgi:hypothetical protein